jgi:hypothetical protein
MTFAAKVQAVALECISDPLASAEDRDAAEQALLPLTEASFERLDVGEIDLYIYVANKLAGTPERLDAFQARDLADRAEEYARKLRSEAEVIATGRAITRAPVPSCKRCAGFDDDALNDLRETDHEITKSDPKT